MLRRPAASCRSAIPRMGLKFQISMFQLVETLARLHEQHALQVHRPSLCRPASNPAHLSGTETFGTERSEHVRADLVNVREDIPIPALLRGGVHGRGGQRFQVGVIVTHLSRFMLSRPQKHVPADSEKPRTAFGANRVLGPGSIGPEIRLLYQVIRVGVLTSQREGVACHVRKPGKRLAFEVPVLLQLCRGVCYS